MLTTVKLYRQFSNFKHEDRMFLVRLHMGVFGPITVKITDGGRDTGLRSFAPDNCRYLVFGGGNQVDASIAWRAYDLLGPHRDWLGQDMHHQGVDFVFYDGLPAIRLTPTADVDELALIDSWLEAHLLKRGEIIHDYHVVG